MDSLIQDTIFSGQFFKNFTRGIAGANRGITMRFGNMLDSDRFFRKGNSGVKEVKHTLDSDIEGGYGCGSKARWDHEMYHYLKDCC
jgi:hypothetical protein